MDAQTLIPLLEAAAKEQGDSIADLCAEIHTNRATWQRWKAGTTKPSVASIRQLIALAKRLAISVSAEDFLRVA